MSKLKLALDIVEDLRGLAISIETLVKSMQGTDDLVETATTVAPINSKPEPITLEQIRAVLAEKSYNGKQLEVKALITEFGGNKLTDIDPSKYEELLKKVGEL